MALALSIAAGNLTAYAAQADAETGATVEQKASGETLNSQGLTYELRDWGGNHAIVTGFSQKVYAKRGNTSYDTNHTLNIPTEVEGNDGTKYTVTEVNINTWEDGKEALTFKKVTIPKAVTGVGSSFSGIESLEYVDFEEGSAMEELGYECFKDCVNLKRIGLTGTDKLPENVSLIDADAFSGCTSLKSIVIPANVGKVHYGAFYGCTSLESVVFETYKDGDNKGTSDLYWLGSDSQYYNGVFEDCTSLKTVVLPTPVVEEWASSYSIGSKCFKNTAIESITIPNGVSGIGKEAFMNTPLKGINLPDSCTSVGRSAFAQTKLNENGLKTPDGKAYGIAFVCKTTVIDDNAFNSVEDSYPHEALDDRVNTTIAGYDNSNADTYAIENDMEFVSLGDWDPCKVTYKGDINGDGEPATPNDLIALIKYINGLSTNINEEELDVNEDGEPGTPQDLIRLIKIMNGLV